MAFSPRRRSLRATAAALFALTAQLFVALATAENKFPIVLVHGFTGWGRNEFAGYKYWGGEYGDWQEQLKTQGYDVRTAELGPFSSDWDRACELYAYIKGGTVNYGINHAKKNDHNVTGRTYAGIFPQWGEVINGEIQKIHLFGHSMGGTTSRMLAQLLMHGTKGAPIEEDPKSHSLFEGGHDWIHSITTVSTPHQGSTLGNMFMNIGDTVSTLIGVVSGALSAVNRDDGLSSFYDAKLDQFGLGPRRQSESLADYIKRVANSAVFKGNAKDNFLYSVSTQGVHELNSWVSDLPHVYYYSYSTASTNTVGGWLVPKIALPKSSMAPLLWPFSLLLGSRYVVDSLKYPESWLTNDGAVNTESMRSPSNRAVVEFTSTSVPGRWQHVARLENVDHLGAIGCNGKQKNLLSVYAAQAAVLMNLPMPRLQQSKRTLRDDVSTEVGEHTAPDEIVRRLHAAVARANAGAEDAQ